MLERDRKHPEIGVRLRLGRLAASLKLSERHLDRDLPG
jgi:hypothetical protein